MSFFDVSLEIANKLYTWGWRGSIFGAIITTIAVSILMWGTRVRDRDFESSVGSLHNKAAGFEREAADARERAAKLERRAAEIEESNITLQRELERERTERLVLEARIRPRTISPENRAKIVTYLATASPKGAIVVIWKRFDEEAEQFGKQIISVLKEAGFDVTEGHGPMGFSERGGWIVVRDMAKLKAEPNAVGAIQAAFREILGIKLDGHQRTDPFPDLGEVVIAIGAKP